MEREIEDCGTCKGTDFPDDVKEEVRRKSGHHCCKCDKVTYVQIHHIEPKGIGGFGTPENAAPLCPECHAWIGHDAAIQRRLVEKRDYWYARMEAIYAQLDDTDANSIAAALSAYTHKDKSVLCTLLKKYGMLLGDDIQASVQSFAWVSEYLRLATTCESCGEAFDSENDKNLHYVIPAIRGGGYTPDNVRVVHAQCNRRLGAGGGL